LVEMEISRACMENRMVSQKIKNRTTI
jgi:hypothetical protein